MKVATLIPRIHRNQTTRLLIKTINLIEAVKLRDSIFILTQKNVILSCCMNLFSGRGEIRTHDLLNANQTFFQLNYKPIFKFPNFQLSQNLIGFCGDLFMFKI